MYTCTVLTAHCQVGPRSLRVPQGSLALGVTTTVGMIQQGILDSVFRLGNTCLCPAQPLQPWFSPGDRAIPHHSNRVHL